MSRIMRLRELRFLRPEFVIVFFLVWLCIFVGGVVLRGPGSMRPGPPGPNLFIGVSLLLCAACFSAPLRLPDCGVWPYSMPRHLELLGVSSVPWHYFLSLLAAAFVFRASVSCSVEPTARAWRVSSRCDGYSLVGQPPA